MRVGAQLLLELGFGFHVSIEARVRVPQVQVQIDHRARGLQGGDSLLERSECFVVPAVVVCNRSGHELWHWQVRIGRMRGCGMHLCGIDIVPGQRYARGDVVRCRLHASIHSGVGERDRLICLHRGVFQTTCTQQRRRERNRDLRIVLTSSGYRRERLHSLVNASGARQQDRELVLNARKLRMSRRDRAQRIDGG